MRPDDITHEEALPAYRAMVRGEGCAEVLAAQNALRDERVRKTERDRIAQEIETLRFPWSRAADHIRAMPDAKRVREGGDTNAQ